MGSKSLDWKFHYFRLHSFHERPLSSIPYILGWRRYLGFLDRRASTTRHAAIDHTLQAKKEKQASGVRPSKHQSCNHTIMRPIAVRRCRHEMPWSSMSRLNRPFALWREPLTTR